MARRILVVEDEAPIREMVCFVLEQNGFQPVEAEDYDSAVNKLNEPWPDLILLDWMLPGGSGLQFIKHLKREAMTRDIPVVMLTARGEEEDRVRELGNLIKRFRSGAESLPDAVVLTTEEGGIFWCNGLAQQILGLRWPDDNGQNILNLLRYPEFTQYLKTRDFTRPLHLVLNTGRHLEIRVMPYTDKQLLMVARDVTQMHQLEGARRNFFANVSHELRTPLTVLQGYLEMMQEQALEGATREKALHTMREQTYRMEGLVKQLLTLSKIEAAPALLLNEKVDVPMMLRVVEREAQTLSQQKHTFTFEVDDSLSVLGNEEQLRSAISNLVYNAVNHTPAGTHITVSWRRVVHGAEFCIQDNGPGIAAEHIPRLTERFYRVDKARSRQTGGSGLGLAIVKHALNHHESRLEIDSSPGKGTRFSFVLPERLIAKNSD